MANGLVNGALGTIIQINYYTQIDKVSKISIKFDHLSEIYELERITADFEYVTSQYVTRSQFPISLAWAITVHKCQGLSLKAVMLDLGTSIFQGGMAYVALSRAFKLENIYIVAFHPSVLYCNQIAFEEYKRLYKQYNIDGFDFTFCNHIFELKIDDQLPDKKINNEHRASNILVPINSVNPLTDFGHYPLRLVNNDNSCYCNVILQALLHLGPNFNNAINQEATRVNNKKKSFKYIYNFYYNKMFKIYTKYADLNSMRLRKFVANFPTNLNDHIYTNKSQQDAWLFFLELLHKLTPLTVQLFQIVIRNKRKCLNCLHEISNDDRAARAVFMSLNESLSETSFDHGFDNITIGECLNCNSDCRQQYKNEIIVPLSTKFVIVHISLFSWTLHGPSGPIKINSKFVNYNVDDIRLPGPNNTSTHCKILALILRHGRSDRTGHYTMIARHLKTNGWVHINDLGTTSYYEKLDQFFDDIKIIFLERLI